MQVGLIGAGNMARALARGWGDPVLVSDGGSGRALELARDLGGEAFDSNVEVADRADLVVLCHKPAQFVDVARELRGHAKAVASVLSGVRTQALRQEYGVPAFRFMPNTPVEVRRGVLCYAAEIEVVPLDVGLPRVAEPEFDPQLESQVLELFGRLGTVVKVPERLIDTAGAVMAVGPAYQALVAEAQVDAAVRHGVAPALAGRLVAETMAGTAALLETRDYDTLAVRREVTSPGGTTARGLAALERGGVRPAFQDAFDAVVGAGR